MSSEACCSDSCSSPSGVSLLLALIFGGFLLFVLLALVRVFAQFIGHIEGGDQVAREFGKVLLVVAGDAASVSRLPWAFSSTHERQRLT